MFCYNCGAAVESVVSTDGHPICIECSTTLFHFKRPSVCADLAVFHDGKLLMIKRARGHNVGKWATPGGHVEPKEHPADAAIREFGEETTIRTSLLSATTVEQLGIYRDIEVGIPENIVIAYRVEFSDRPEVKLTDEIDGFGWFTMREISRLDTLFVAKSIAVDAFTINGRYKP